MLEGKCNELMSGIDSMLDSKLKPLLAKIDVIAHTLQDLEDKVNLNLSSIEVSDAVRSDANDFRDASANEIWCADCRLDYLEAKQNEILKCTQHVLELVTIAPTMPSHFPPPSLAWVSCTSIGSEHACSPLDSQPTPQSVTVPCACP